MSAIFFSTFCAPQAHKSAQLETRVLSTAFVPPSAVEGRCSQALKQVIVSIVVAASACSRSSPVGPALSDESTDGGIFKPDGAMTQPLDSQASSGLKSGSHDSGNVPGSTLGLDASGGQGQVPSAGPEILAAPSRCAFRTDSLAHEPGPAPPLDIGHKWVDSAFGGCVQRLTDSGNKDRAFLRHDYSRLQALSRLGRFMLTAAPPEIIDIRTGRIVHRVDVGWPMFAEGVRWSPTEPGTLYATGGFAASSSSKKPKDGCPSRAARLFRYVLSQDGTIGHASTVACFPEYAKIDRAASFEALSSDGNFLALLGITANRRREVFSVDLRSGTKGQVYSIPADVSGVEWVAASPSAKYVIVCYRSNGWSRHKGVEAYDRETMSYLGKVGLTTGHGDLAMDAEGNEYFVYDASSDTLFNSDGAFIVRVGIPDGITIGANGRPDREATLNSGRATRLMKKNPGACIPIPPAGTCLIRDTAS